MAVAQRKLHDASGSYRLYHVALMMAVRSVDRPPARPREPCGGRRPPRSFCRRDRH